MSYIDIVESAWIEYLNGKWRYERRQSHTTEWRHTRTNEHAKFTDREIMDLVTKGEMKLYSGHGRAPSKGKASKVHGQRGPTKADWEEAGRRLKFVLAIHDAGLFRPDVQFVDWEPVISQVFQQHGAGWTFLRGTNKGKPVEQPSLKTVQRWVADGGEKPTLKKLLPKHRHKGRYEDRLAPELRAFIAERVRRDYMKRPAINIEALQVIIHIELEELNKPRIAKGLKPYAPPGLKAINSSIDAIPRDELVRSRYGDMAAFLKYGSAEAQADPVAPLDRVELDATVCDLFLVDPETMLPIGRPTLVVALDRCTRMVLGWFVTFEKPSVLALMQCLRNAILPKTYLDEVKEENGWVIENEPETGGLPRLLVLDRARENIAEHVARLAVRAGINRIEIMGGKKPWLKGAVERVIKTISEKLLHPAKGTTFHNALMRMGYDGEKDAVCTPDDLDYALHKFFIDIYPFEKRRSLNNRQPIKVWREKTRKHPVDFIGEIEDVAHLFGRTERGKPGRHGLNYANMQYFSTELLQLQTLAVFKNALAKQGGELEFHVDPSNLGKIVVRLPHRDGTIDVPAASKWLKYATGLSLWHHRKIREFADEEARQDGERLLRAKYDLMTIMKGSAMAKRGGLRARGLQARMDGVLGQARAGSDASATVVGTNAHAAQVAAKTGKATQEGVTSNPKPPRPSNDDRGRPDLKIVKNGDGVQTANSEPTPVIEASAAPAAAPPRKKKGYKP